MGFGVDQWIGLFDCSTHKNILIQTICYMVMKENRTRQTTENLNAYSSN